MFKHCTSVQNKEHKLQEVALLNQEIIRKEISKIAAKCIHSQEKTIAMKQGNIHSVKNLK